MSENTIICSNCSQPIAESKHMLHETYCLRNNIKCLRCGQFYDRNDPEVHEAEYHKKENCQYCQQEFEDLNKHKCIKKPKQCMHCDLFFPSDQLYQHENQCGSRTQKCDICNNYVLMREYQNHVFTCQPKPKAQPTKVQKKPSSQEIFDNPDYDKPKIDDRIDQQQFNQKKETSQSNAQGQINQKQQVQQQQQQYYENRPQGSGYKFGAAAVETKAQYQIKDEDKNNKQKNGNRPPSSNNQTASRTQQQTPTQGTQQKQQTYSTQNSKLQNNTQKEDKTQFDNKFEKQQYIKQQQQQQTQPQSQYQQQQQQKSYPSGQKSLESYKNYQNSSSQYSNQNARPEIRRPDTAIVREIQKQFDIEEEFGISTEEYISQQFSNQSLQEGNQRSQGPSVKKVTPPQPVIPPSRVPQKFDNQKFDNQEFDFEGITEEEKLIQQQLIESFQFSQKKR